ncbi:hypothetical protein BKA62DRAFT_822052 [Auriculariales sp. MPI-PUGE-AT-0066]|nr:hypothetical protein BKA62DRAFT_822052 [Auriculariales sp. MPI-PUGE-AT-0066]
MSSAPIMRSLLVHLIFTIIAFVSVGTKAAITKAGCSGNACIQFRNGRPCYYDLTLRFTRTTVCVHPRMTTLLNQHTTSPPPNASALAYYHLDDNSFLGGADLPLTEYAVALGNSDIAICLTGGLAATRLFLSTCRLARSDDDHIGRDLVDVGCALVHTFGAGVVQEGCSTPPTHN